MIDVYQLVTDGDRYRYDGQWRQLEKQRVWLPVKLWGPFVLPVPKTVYRAVQGPVIVNKGGSYAIRYGGGDQLVMVEAYYRLNRATDFTQWQAALAMQGIPGTNFLYGDAAGNIAFFYNASFPHRKPGFDYSKVLPGDTSSAYEPGTVPWSMIPRNVNPASGFLINGNNSPYQAAGPGSEIPPQPPLLGVETDTTNRGDRALELMSAVPLLSEEDLKRIKFDTGVAKGGYLETWFKELLAVDPQGDNLLAEARELLSQWDWNWDGKGPADSLAFSILRTPHRFHYERRPKPDPRAVMAEAAGYLRKHFGKLDVPLGELIRLRQGQVDLPMDGGPDSLRAATSYDEAPDGRLAIRHGDSFIMFVTWDKTGKVRSESSRCGSIRRSSKRIPSGATGRNNREARFSPAAARPVA
jgi:acyl-homoserine-lactone acylase